MSHGTEGTFATKKAFREYVQVNGADNVFVLDTSVFITPDMRRVSVASLADTSACIVGPDVSRDRRWYANVKAKKDGSIVIV